MTAQTHDRMTAWACCNAILRFCKEAEVPFGEWTGTIGEAFEIDPVDAANKIRIARRLIALAA